jgi:hypothetical protein
MDIPIADQPYITSLEEIIWGGTLVAITMSIHGFGMLWVLRLIADLKQRSDRHPSFAIGMGTLILASWLILLVHLIEVFAWAGFFFWKDAVAVPKGSATGSLCYYFGLMDYTTLGSIYNLKDRWRLLEGMIAMAGLLTFAWSTGVLLSIAQDFQDQQMQLLKRRQGKHGTQTVVSEPGAGSASGSPPSCPAGQA